MSENLECTLIPNDLDSIFTKVSFISKAGSMSKPADRFLCKSNSTMNKAVHLTN